MAPLGLQRFPQKVQFLLSVPLFSQSLVFDGATPRLGLSVFRLRNVCFWATGGPSSEMLVLGLGLALQGLGLELRPGWVKQG